jgi:uncharacterized protein (TIGR03086 family)
MDLYDRASSWAATKVAGAKDAFGQQTPCDGWTVRDLLNHMVEGNQYFAASARGEDPSLPEGKPSDIVKDPTADYERSRQEMMKAFGGNGGGEKMQSLGIAFVEQLVHAWDLAKATGQKTEMPGDLAEAAWQMIGGKMTPDQRGGLFGPEVPVAEDAPVQEKLLGYAGRKP